MFFFINQCITTASALSFFGKLSNWTKNEIAINLKYWKFCWRGTKNGFSFLYNRIAHLAYFTQSRCLENCHPKNNCIPASWHIHNFWKNYVIKVYYRYWSCAKVRGKRGSFFYYLCLFYENSSYATSFMELWYAVLPFNRSKKQLYTVVPTKRTIQKNCCKSLCHRSLLLKI